MHVRIVVDDPILREMWGVKKDSIRVVTKMYRDNRGMKFQIAARVLYESNNKGKIERIWLRENEVKIKK